MSGWRSHDGQRSDRQPIKRTDDDKRRLLQRLKDERASFKPWVADAVKSALNKRIIELEAELAPARR
ncbi:MAG: hypothetical protein EPN20_20385 [Magnetospirillum sp.]|nr:MAG: hypothetical protein EPN20_20385 [Magnetospirillum sp.]